MATAIVFTSPLLVYGGHPQTLIDSPAADIIRNIPATWEETIVLPGSEIGELAAFARRKGREWFIGVLNGAGTRTFTVNPVFLGSARFSAVLARDTSDNAAAITVERTSLDARDPIRIELREGGGFAAHLVPQAEPR